MRVLNHGVPLDTITVNDGVGSVVGTADDGKKLQTSFDDSPAHVHVTVELKPNRVAMDIVVEPASPLGTLKGQRLRQAVLVFSGCFPKAWDESGVYGFPDG
jgi:hypothetical protein